MPRVLKPGISLLVLFLMLSSCAVSQPSNDTDTKNDRARRHFMTAIYLLETGETERALSEVNAALSRDSEYMDALLLKADILKLLARYEESQAVYDLALSKRDDLPEVYLYMGEMQFRAAWYDRAAESLNRFLQSQPGEEKKKQAEQLLANVNFAAVAVKNPVPFEPKNMGYAINTEFPEYFPGITADGEYFIFTRRITTGGMPQEDFFLSRRINDTTWGPAYNLGPPVNTPENEGSVSISTDGQFIFFTACNRSVRYTTQGQEMGARPGEIFGGCDLYFTRMVGDKWGMPRHLGKRVNSNSWDSYPSLSFDGLTLYFASTRPGGFGGSDIWKCVWTDSGFSAPINLGPGINTPGNEETPFIHPDNQTLYFSSNGRPGMGGFDYYYCRLEANGEWGEPVNMGYPINTFGDEKGLFVDRAGRLAYFSSDDRPDSKGSVDIYQFELYPEARPQELNYVKATVVDDETGEPLEASAQLLSIQTGLHVLTTTTNKSTGAFLIVLQAPNDYALNVSREGYLFHSENFSLSKGTQSDPFLIEVRLKKLKVDQNVVLNNVFFDVDSYVLKPESRVELDKLVEFLQKQPGVKMEIGGHTDNTGNPASNQKLSENRAKAVYDYLISKGIDPNRLSYKGYGAGKPIADNATEEGKRKNRRTEYRITGV